MKPIRFTLHYLVKALYKLWTFIWAPIVVFSAWYAVGYLMSRLSVFRDMFDKGTSDWYMIMVLPLFIVSVVGLLFMVFSVIIVTCELLWEIITSVRNNHLIKKLKDSYKNFK